MTAGPSAPPPADERAPAPAEPPAHVTITQIVASALAAVTATVTLSWLGVAGTIVGAAIASVVTVIGNTVYSRSLRRTQDRVLALRKTILPAPSGSVAPPAVPGHDPGSGASPPPGATRVERPSFWPRLAARYGRGRMLVAVTVLLFVGILATVTVVELATGKPLSDLLRGRRATGTTLFDGGTNGGTPSRQATPTATPTSPTSTAVSSTSPQSTATPSEAPSQTTATVSVSASSNPTAPSTAASSP
jgi:hypothetical protein